MNSADDGKVYYLRVTEKIMRIFFVNNAQDPVLLTINYGQPLADKISIPVGNSNLCLCSNSDKHARNAPTSGCICTHKTRKHR